MNKTRPQTKLIQEGKYVAEVDVELIDSDHFKGKKAIIALK